MAELKRDSNHKLGFKSHLNHNSQGVRAKFGFRVSEKYLKIVEEDSHRRTSAPRQGWAHARGPASVASERACVRACASERANRGCRRTWPANRAAGRRGHQSMCGGLAGSAWVPSGMAKDAHKVPRRKRSPPVCNVNVADPHNQTLWKAARLMGATRGRSAAQTFRRMASHWIALEARRGVAIPAMLDDEHRRLRQLHGSERRSNVLAV